MLVERGWPCWVAVNRYREYAAARNLLREIGRIVEEEVDRILEMSIISLMRLMEGGPAMFMVVRMNHISDIDGTKFIRPLVRNILRVLVVS